VKDVESVVVSVLSAVVIGWCSKFVALVTDPILTAISQYAQGLGGVGSIIVIAVVIWFAYEDYRDFVSMGVFAIPAIIALVLPWGASSILMFFSVVLLAIMHKDSALEIFKRFFA